MKKHRTLFAATCLFVALLYSGYRIVIFIESTALAKDALHPNNTHGVCSHSDEEKPHVTTAQTMSQSYHALIDQQPALGKNLVKNPGMEQTDPLTADPDGYDRIIENKHTTYQYLQDPVDKKGFLRTLGLTKSSENEPARGWIMNAVPIEKDQTYAYSAEYRSNIPIDISIEYVNADGKPIYETIATEPAADSWRKFSAHTLNNRNAKTFRFTITGADPGQVDVRNFDVHQIADSRLAHGVVSITFDDGWQSIADKAVPLLQNYHFKSTQYVISNRAADKTQGYMSIATLQKLKAAGHEIGSHTLDHCDQTKLTFADVTKNALQSKAALEKANLGPITGFAYPYGSYSQSTQDILAKQYELVRNSDFGYNDRYFDRQALHTATVTNKTTDQEFRAWLDYAATNKAWLILVYHRVDEHGEYNITSKQLDKQLSLIKESKLPVLTVNEASRSIRHR